MALNTNKREGDKLHAEEWNELVQEVQGKQSRLNIVDALDSDSNVDVLSAKQGNILNNKIEDTKTIVQGIETVIETLPVGYFYGTFTIEEELPSEISEKGYAYVGTAPNYVIYTYEPTIGWSITNNKYGTSPLETDLETKSQTKAPTTKAVQEGIEAIDVTLARSAEEENELTTIQKFNASSNINDRCADVVQGTGEINSLGYKILNPNKSFASQVTASNTIYEIRDKFDLNNQSVSLNIDNITLKFNGGKLINGTLSGNNSVHIEAGPVKIFDNISFSGGIIYNKFKVEWFVDIYEKEWTTTTINSTKDASSQLQEAFNCGVLNIIFTERRWYPVRSTINIIGGINIDTTLETSYIGTSGSNNGQWIIEPCIFSKEVATLVDYTYTHPTKTNCVLRGLNLYTAKAYSYDTLEEWETIKNTPILDFHNTTNIWGLDIDCQIQAKLVYYDHSSNPEIGKQWYVPGYTGIRIRAQGSTTYTTYINIKGYIQGTWYGIIAYNEGFWMTDFTVNASTKCTLGGKISVGPCNIYGSHQPIHSFSANYYTQYYWESVELSLRGFVWDLGRQHKDSKLYACAYLAKDDNKNEANGDVVYNQGNKVSRTLYSYTDLSNLFVKLPPNKLTRALLREHKVDNGIAALSGNYFTFPATVTLKIGISNGSTETTIDGTPYYMNDTALSAKSNSTVIVPDGFIILNETGTEQLINTEEGSVPTEYHKSTSFKYRVASSTAFTNVNVKNKFSVSDATKPNNYFNIYYKEDLFGHTLTTKSIATANSLSSSPVSQLAFKTLEVPEGASSIEVSNVDLVIEFKTSEYEVRRDLYLYVSSYNFNYCDVEIFKNGTSVFHNNSIFYFNPSPYARISISSGTIKINIKFKNPSPLFAVYMPTLYIPDTSFDRYIESLTTEQLDNNIKPIKDVFIPSHYGTHLIYNSTLGKMVYPEERKYKDCNGYTMAANKGTSANRPQLNKSTDIGYPYFDTTLGKPLFWNGTAWVDAGGSYLPDIQISTKDVLLGKTANSSKTVNVYTSDAPTHTEKNPDNTDASSWLSASLNGTTLTITALTDNNKKEAPNWITNTFYAENNGEYILLSTKPNDWDENYANYYTKENDVYISVVGNPVARGGKVILTNTTDEVIINVVQNYI